MKSFELLSKIALTAINSSDFNSQMNFILELVGQYTKVSRTYIFIDNNENTATSNKFEWCNSGIKSQIKDLKDVSYKNIPSWREILLKEGRVYSENILELPEDIIAILQPQGIISLVVYPIYIANKIQGFIGFDECKIKRNWNDSDLNLLATISGIISTVYERNYNLIRMNEEKRNFENFFNTIDDLVVIGNLSGDVLFVNNSVITKLGYSMEELLKMKIIEMHPIHKRDEAMEILNSMFDGTRDHCPLELASKEGKIVPVETRVWFGKWNNQDCVFGLSKDLSREQEALQKFTKLFENNPALMAVSSIPERIFIEVNSSFINKMGYSKDEILGKTGTDLGLFIQSEKQNQVADQLQKSGKIHNIELQVKCKNGEILDGLFSGEIIESQGQKYLLTVMVDITSQKYLQNLYDSQRLRLLSVIEGARLGTWEWFIQTGETIFNDTWANIIGYKLDELQPTSIKTWINLCHPDDLKNSNDLLKKHFNGISDYYDIECRMKHKNGQWIWIHDRGKVIEWDKDGNPYKMYGTHSDITEKKELENAIKELSIRDPLTNIYNRRYIFERLDIDLNRFKRENSPFSLSILDIDLFKLLNDNYGHLAGDYILKQFTSIISENVRVYDLLGRYGGEEFIVIMYNINRKEASVRIEYILQIIRQMSFQYNNNTLKFTFSCGVSDTYDFSYENLSIENMVSFADKRLYAAKNAGRNRIIYDGNI
jgi:diguanylate cyclase (GGDEF)-like protein/PAS domain S-box-containing protein